ncbi:MAG: ribbon-helix-helix domain-containing protein [Candidatus Bathyarchaeota archaeon]
MIKLGRITVVISDEMEKKLRLEALEIYGGRKGDLSRAVEEAIKNWVTSKKKGRPTRH